MTTTHRRDELIDQLDWHWQHHLCPRLDDLTEDAYLWEPVRGCWSLRRRQDAVTPMAVGAADTVIDYEYPEPVPAPVTTIAWRMGHVSIGVLGSRAANHFGDGGIAVRTTDWPLSASGGVDLLRHHYDAWITGLRSLNDAALERPCGPSEGPYAEHSFGALVLHITREVIHHGAEICLLMDLFRERHRWTGDRA